MAYGLIAQKVGMTRVFDGEGKHIPVTVLHVADCEVTGHATQDKNGYTAVQLGAFNQKEQRVNQPELGNFKKANVTPKKVVKEFRLPAGADLPAVGSAATVEQFTDGQFVDVTGISKGKGFAGAMKRWNFGGLRASHGVSVSHRSHGSTGQNQDPGHVFKGKKMAGHYGHARVTQLNLQVVKVDADKGVLLVKGSIPGPKGQTVFVRDAVKKPAAA